MDVAPEVTHQRPTRRRARDAAARASHRVMPRGFFFFKPTRLRLWPIRTKSGRLGPYRHESVVSAVSAETAEMVDSGQN